MECSNEPASMSFIVIIPARYASTRLPGKALADVGGRPMIEQVWRRASASGASRVVIATDDSRVQKALAGCGAEVCLTRADHVSGTDRLQEVAERLGLADDQIVINVQGDEPLIPPAVIDQLADNLANSNASMATLAEPLTRLETLFDPNVVKIVTGSDGCALYFSRAPIPWDRDALAAVGESSRSGELATEGPWLRHIGIYGYRVGLLHRFVGWPQGRLEQLEKLEQLRVLEQGERIHVAAACVPIPGGVDTPADLERVRSVLIAAEAD